MLDVVRWQRSPWSIFDELESLQADMNRAFAAGDRPWRRRRPRYPLLNVWSSEDGLVIDAEVPGVDPKDVDISVKGDELTLSGKVNTVGPPEGESVHRNERPSGEFARVLQLPFRADAGDVRASYKNGILRVTVPKTEEEKPRKIAIES